MMNLSLPSCFMDFSGVKCLLVSGHVVQYIKIMHRILAWIKNEKAEEYHTELIENICVSLDLCHPVMVAESGCHASECCMDESA